MHKHPAGYSIKETNIPPESRVIYTVRAANKHNLRWIPGYYQASDGWIVRAQGRPRKRDLNCQIIRLSADPNPNWDTRWKYWPCWVGADVDREDTYYNVDVYAIGVNAEGDA